MTEAEWLGSTEPQVFLNFIRPRSTERKLALFACACCRLIWHLLADERSRQAVVVVERHTDGLASTAEMEQASSLAGAAAEDAAATPGNPLAMLATAAVDYALFPLDDSSILMVCEFTARALEGEALWAAGASAEMLETWVDEYAENRPVDSAAEAILCELIHDIFGNPYRPNDLDPAWLTSTVRNLAQAIYEEQTLDRLPILADALEEAGCVNIDVLSHARQASSHVRGCWLLDSINAGSAS